MNLIRIALTDDQELFVQAMKALLEDTAEFKVVITAKSGKELLDKLRRRTADVLLLDIDMPGMDGFEITKIINSRHPEVRIMALSMHQNDTMITSMFEYGARGYLSKSTDPQVLKQAIYSVMKTGFYLDEEVSRALAKRVRNPKDASSSLNPLNKITSNEMRVLELICREMSSEEIAAEMSISARTVHGYRESLRTKTGAKNAAGLVLFAVKYQLVDIH